MKKALFALAAAVVTTATVAHATPVDCRKNCTCVISPSLICPPTIDAPAALAPAAAATQAVK
jgi:hypothetical protein